MSDQQDEPRDALPDEAAPQRLPSAKVRATFRHQSKAIRLLSHEAARLAMDIRRIRELVLLKDRHFGKNGERVRKRSEVRRHDRPEIELVLHRSAEIARLDALMVEAEAKLKASGAKAEDLAAPLATIAELNAQKMRHLTRVEDALTAIGKDLTASKVILAKTASDMAHLEQAKEQHRDKMALAEKAGRTPSNNELRQRMAEKYGVPVSEIDAILSAKPVDPEP